jgi:hypothetical protein
MQRIRDASHDLRPLKSPPRDEARAVRGSAYGRVPITLNASRLQGPAAHLRTDRPDN